MGSPIFFFLLIAFCCHPILCNGLVSCFTHERDALLSLKNDLIDGGNGLPSVFLSWKGLNCCEWDGVQCSNRTSHVIKLYIPRNTLSGALNPDLFGLKYLEYLDLSFNGLMGIIPAGLFTLTHLRHLDLRFNNFEGEIPTAIASLQSLTYLNLGGAGFSGTVPYQIGNLSRLQFLDLSYYGNHEITNLGWIRNLKKLTHLSVTSMNLSMSGKRFGEHISDLRDLHYLDVMDCGLSGSIPAAIHNLTSITDLFLSYNMFSFQIPSWLGNMTALHSLWLEHNQLSEVIPASLGRLTSLRDLRLSDNQLNGMIPPSLGRLYSLRTLGLSNNKLTGSIPTFESQALETISLESNNLQGDVFLDSFQNSTTLRSLAISHNELTVHVDPLWIPKIYLIYLDLASCRIGGNLPAFLSTQYRLWYLDLSDNNFVGSIPSWFEELKNLQFLNLSHNYLEGHLPSNFNQAQFVHLDLHRNSLSGPLPIPHVISNISVLDLSDNRFTGVIPKNIGMLVPQIEFFSCSMNDVASGIPASIGILQELRVLDLSRNEVNGRIPLSITNCSALEMLNLASNSLTGNIPSDIGRLRSLQSLHLNDNSLEGNLPESLLNCSSLQILDLGNNLMSGKIPVWIAQFSKLMILILRANRFQGHIPPQLSNLSSLHVLDISQNRLSGFIPKEFGKLAGVVAEQVKISIGYESSNYYYEERIQVTTKEMTLDISRFIFVLITCIDLSGNQLSGKIPLEIGNLKGLRILNISRNNVGGEIPSTLGMMRQLESLDLSRNKLEGKIPPEMLQLSFLEVLNMSHNMLEGRIPLGGQFSTFSATSFFGNNGLCGFPLNNTCGPSKASIPAEEDEDGEIPWHWYVEWMASCAVGFWGVIGVLYVKKDWRRGYIRALDKVVVRLDKRVGLSKVLWG